MMNFFVVSRVSLVMRYSAIAVVIVLMGLCAQERLFAQNSKPGIDAKSAKALSFTKFYYGKRFAIRCKLDEASSQYPLSQFLIGYKLGNSNEEFAPFSESFLGQNIPAAARLVRFRIVWLSGRDTTTLFTREVEVEQTPPDISSAGAAVEVLSSEGHSIRLAVKGIAVDYEVPIDADNSNPNASRSIKASLGEVEAVGTPKINFEDSHLVVYNEVHPDRSITLKLTAENLVLVEGNYDEKTGIFPMILEIKDLPDTFDHTILRGKIALTVQVKIVNRKAGKSAISTSPPALLSLAIPLASNFASINSDDFDAWLNGYVRLQSLPKALSMLTSAKHLTTYVAGAAPDAVEAEWEKKYNPSQKLGKGIQGAIIFADIAGGKVNVLAILPAKMAMRVNGSSVSPIEYVKKALSDTVMLNFVQSHAQLKKTDAVERGGGKFKSWYDFYTNIATREYNNHVYQVNIGYPTRKRIDGILRSRRDSSTSNIRVFVLDSLATASFRATITPSLPKTDQLLQAEKDCPTTREIMNRIGARQPIPAMMTDNPACETVKNYYASQSTLVRIQYIFVICENSPQEGNKVIAATKSFSTALAEDIPYTFSPTTSITSLIEESSRSPLIPSQDLAKEKCIEWRDFPKTPHKTVLEYINAMIKEGKLRDVTAEFRK